MTAEPTIRVAGADEVERLRPVWSALVHHHHAIGSAPLAGDGDDAWSIRRAAYRDAIASGAGSVVLAEADGQVVGYATIFLHPRPDDTFPVGRGYAEIDSLAVLPDWRSRGVGRRLMDAVESRIAGLGLDAVAVAAMIENEAALAFYRRRGFVPREVVMWRLPAASRPPLRSNDDASRDADSTVLTGEP